MKDEILTIALLAEKIHRRSLNLMSNYLAQRGVNDLNATQALILLRIGTERITPTEIRSRGHYLGSNVSYNLRKLVNSGYIVQERSTSDLRVINISLSKKGLRLRSHLENFYLKLGNNIGVKPSSISSHPIDALERIDQIVTKWIDAASTFEGHIDSR